MVKAAKSVATVRMEAVVTTFQELVLARPDGEELCKCTTTYYTYVGCPPSSSSCGFFTA